MYQPEHTRPDVVVIGGGPAGLQATLTLARVHRRVLMIDSGSYRNDPTDHMHNVVTNDGVAPAQFRTAARAELQQYDTVTVRDAAVTAVERSGDGFVVRIGDEQIEARGIVLATGVVDELPATAGVAELFGSVIAHCPFCHGHEFAGGRVGILGVAGAGHLPGIVAPFAAGITVFTDGEELTAAVPADVVVRTEKVLEVTPAGGGATVHLTGGDTVEVKGLFVTTGLRQRAPFAHQLGLALNPSGCVEVDVMGRTSLPGVHAAGDMAHQSALPMPMATVTNAIAAGANAAGAVVAHLS
ncbi:thioredoxin reductase [Calidifontibacter indicus]|uniref:Thioredoxin reductase n=2 Tax=Calidifontibacter indicus TaxID=419650 RepID=A0A3D9ULE1_9MICO|nr:thioredoxin reductase [Calidifontibacter indicus]